MPVSSPRSGAEAEAAYRPLSRSYCSLNLLANKTLDPVVLVSRISERRGVDVAPHQVPAQQATRVSRSRRCRCGGPRPQPCRWPHSAGAPIASRSRDHCAVMRWCSARCSSNASTDDSGIFQSLEPSSFSTGRSPYSISCTTCRRENPSRSAACCGESNNRRVAAQATGAKIVASVVWSTQHRRHTARALPRAAPARYAPDQCRGRSPHRAACFVTTPKIARNAVVHRPWRRVNATRAGQCLLPRTRSQVSF